MGTTINNFVVHFFYNLYLSKRRNLFVSHRDRIDLMGMVIQRNRNLAEAVFRDALIDEGVFADRIF